MSEIIKFSRNDLYERYKKSNPELAEKFLGKKYPSPTLAILGGGSLTSVFLTAIIVVSILASCTNGFGPVKSPDFYPIISRSMGGVFGSFAAMGLISLAIWYCKKRHVLAEELSLQEINCIAERILLNPTELMSL